jgi:uncharacterized protein YdhG (YjbR/CyaY superfamily)
MATSTKADGEADVLTAIAAMSDNDRAMGERLHKIITTTAPDLVPRTWYGMPAYTKEGKIICFFRDRQKFKERYMTLGFNDVAQLDDGTLWPISYALTELTDGEETRIAEIIKKAVG